MFRFLLMFNEWTSIFGDIFQENGDSELYKYENEEEGLL